MTKMKKLFAALLCVALLLSAAGCKGSDNSTATTENKQKPAAPTEKGETPTVPAEPQTPVEEEAALLFNEAVRLLNEAQSYTMTGSVNSTSEMETSSAVVVTSIDCAYEKDSDGAARMLMNSVQNMNGTVFEHSTYVADGKYYITAIGTNYVVASNDFGDYDAALYAKPVEDIVLTEVQILPDADGAGQQVSFQIPFGVYASEALIGFLGDLIDDSLFQQPLTVRANIDADGMLAGLYLSIETSTSFADESINQLVIASLNFTGYNSTTVTAPENLESYEDRSVSGEIDSGMTGIGEVTDGSLD